MIAFLELQGRENNQLKKVFAQDELLLFKDNIDKVGSERLQDAQILSIFIGSHLTSAVLTKLPRLKFIATRSTGFDHIDLGYCREHNITISNVPTYGENTVAEHAFALILVLTRKIIPAIQHTREGGFSVQGLRGVDLKGKTIGVVGAGHIGQHVIRIAHGFEMNVLVADPFCPPNLPDQLKFELVELTELLAKADIVTVHVPYNKSTHHLINQDNIQLMKKGAYLINTARGGIIETEAILKALRQNRLAGVGLDVLEAEKEFQEELELLVDYEKREMDYRTVLENHLLLEDPRVIITPHNAFNSIEGAERILETTIENIQRFKQGQPVNLVKA